MRSQTVKSGRKCGNHNRSTRLLALATRLADAPTMWLVTTEGDVPDDYEQREHRTAVDAWNDYQGRILELEINGFTRDTEEGTQYGRRPPSFVAASNASASPSNAPAHHP